MDRLTTRYLEKNQYVIKGDNNFEKFINIVHKLGRLEDIMEDYEVETTKGLEEFIESLLEKLNNYSKKNIEYKKQLSIISEQLENCKTAKAHFKSVAYNECNALRDINKALPKPQQKEINFQKVADDVVNLIKHLNKQLKEQPKKICDAVRMQLGLMDEDGCYFVLGDGCMLGSKTVNSAIDIVEKEYKEKYL